MAGQALEITPQEAQMIKAHRQNGGNGRADLGGAEAREFEYQDELKFGAAHVAQLVQRGYDIRLADVATSFRLLLGPQFSTKDFLGEVGRVRLRKLEPITVDLTDAVGAYVPAVWTVTAPADRHQLVLGIALEVQGTDAAGVVEYRDMAQLDAAGVLQIERPQSDTVAEAWSDYSMGAQPVETDGLVVRPNGIYHRKRNYGFSELTPGGIPMGMMYSFAGLLMLNDLVLTMNNLAAAGLVTPSATLLKATLHVYVFDCIKGGK